MIVETIWVSLRYPAGKLGRSGRSVSRQVRMARSVGRPSRRKNEPGMRPAAYMRSSTSTVRGKKSIPSRTLLAALAVTRVLVPPMLARTAPWLCRASLPVSKTSSLSAPAMGAETRVGSVVMCVWLLCCRRPPRPLGLRAADRAGSWGRASSQSAHLRSDVGDRRLAADRCCPCLGGGVRWCGGRAPGNGDERAPGPLVVHLLSGAGRGWQIGESSGGGRGGEVRVG